MPLAQIPPQRQRDLELRRQAILSLCPGANNVEIAPGASPGVTPAKELAGCNTSKGSIRSPIAEPPPAALVRQRVTVQLAEHEVTQGKRAKVTKYADAEPESMVPVHLEERMRA